MSIEDADIVGMTDRDFTEYLGSLLPTEAESHVERLMRAGQDHSYFRAQDVDHKRTVDRVVKLREKAHEGDPDLRQFNAAGEEVVADVSPEIAKICENAMAEQADKQVKVVDRGQAVLKELRELGFDQTSSFDEDEIDEELVGIWEMQKANAEGDYHALGDMITKALRAGRESNEIHQLFETFRGTELDPELKSNLSHQIIAYLNESRKARKAKLTDQEAVKKRMAELG